MNYQRVEKAIEYLLIHHREQPSLDRLAAIVNLSPSHFQRLFTDWAGVSPKKFIQYLSLSHAKAILAQQGASVMEAAHIAGLSGSGRLHDLFVSIEGMTPGEFARGGEQLTIDYSYEASPFGSLLAAATPRGICHLMFFDDKDQALEELLARFPNARFQQFRSAHIKNAISFFQQGLANPSEIKLHLKGTPFQLKVWESLLRIPEGQLATYGALASQIGQPSASRAVGTAIGSNPVAVIIPCHRVIQASGHFGGYRWGAPRKSALIGWEAARQDREG